MRFHGRLRARLLRPLRALPLAAATIWVGGGWITSRATAQTLPTSSFSSTATGGATAGAVGASPTLPPTQWPPGAVPNYTAGGSSTRTGRAAPRTLGSGASTLRDREPRQRGSVSASRTGTPAGSQPALRTPAAQPGMPARAVPQGVSVVQRQPGARGASAARGAGRALPEPAVLKDQRSSALFVSPPIVHVQPGDRFITSIRAYNVDNDPIDRFDVWLRFDAKVLAPTGFDSPLSESSSGVAVEAQHWPDEGWVHIAGRLPNPIKDTEVELARIHWRALGPTPGARIELEAPPDETVALWSGERNLAQPKFLAEPAVVGATVRILPPAAERPEPGLRQVDAARRIELLPPPETPLERVRLAIVAQDHPVEPGEVATADLVLLNPRQEPIESIKLRVRYDPTVLQVLDADADNYIAEGINIYDGGFHDRFPFEVYLCNRVDPAAGVIEYEVGSAAGPRPYPSGVFARIVFRLLRPTAEAALWFERIDPFTGAVATDVRSMGRSLLDVGSGDPAAALHGTLVAVRSPAASLRPTE